MVTNGKAKRFRASKISEAIINSVCEKMRAANCFDPACWASGISPRTGYYWLKHGEEDDETDTESLFRDFYYAVREAEAQAEIDDIRDIRNGCDNWQSKAWIRERRTRERWGRVDKHEITGEGGKEIVFRVVYDNTGSNNTSPES